MTYVKPRIKELRKTDDTDRFTMNGKLVVISSCLMAITGKTKWEILAEIIKFRQENGK